MRKYFGVMLLANILAFPSLLANEGLSDTNTKNVYHSEVAEFLAEQPTIVQYEPTDYVDTFFLEAFKEVVPTGSPIIRITSQECPHLFALIEKISSELGIPAIRLYLSPDNQNIDVKFRTLNDHAGLLIHNKTLQAMTHLHFKNYLRQALGRIQTYLYHHTRAYNAQLSAKFGISIVALTVAALTARLTNSYLNNKTTAIAITTTIALIAGGIIGGLLNQHSVISHSYGRLSSYNNQEEAREDIYPEPKEGDIMKPEFIYNASPDHLIRLIQIFQEYIRKRNEDFSRLKEMEDEGRITERDLIGEPRDALTHLEET